MISEVPGAQAGVVSRASMCVFFVAGAGGSSELSLVNLSALSSEASPEPEKIFIVLERKTPHVAPGSLPAHGCWVMALLSKSEVRKRKNNV